MEPNLSIKKALIIIDVQRGFLDPSWGPRNNPNAESAVAMVLAQARKAGVAVFHVRHASTKSDSPLRLGQVGHEFMPEAQPLDDEPVITKRVHSALIGTDLDTRLRRDGIKHLLLAGITTDHCVSTTARMAANMGYQVTVLADATATFDRYDEDGEVIPATLVHRVTLASLKREFATISTVAQTVW